jgi:hypothetical protein
MERRVYVERQKLKSWLKGEIPKDYVLEALARIFSETLKREVSMDELLGKREEMTKFILVDHWFKPGVKAVEIWKDGRFIGSIYPTENGVKIVSKHLKPGNSSKQIKFDFATMPPAILIDIFRR